MSDATIPFVRERLTWLMYLVLGYYCYLLNGLGPVMPFLRAELQMSYTLSSLHFSAFAVGILCAGLSSDRMIRRCGRRQTFWVGALGMLGGVLLLILGRHPFVTIFGAFVMGAIGSLPLVIIPAVLSDHYGDRRAIALSEANMIASLCGGFAPIAIGFSVRMQLGWRAAFILIMVIIVMLKFVFRRVTLPETRLASVQTQTSHQRLPRRYWWYWNMLVLAVSVEFCIIFWCAAFLETERHVPRADAALTVSVFLAAMVLGRWLGSRLSRMMPSEDIVLASVGVALCGFGLHWLAAAPALTMSGLFIAGLGVANLYPQLLSLAVGVAAGQTDLASARASLASGAAILALPLLLGSLADQIGLGAAYGLAIPILIAIGVGLIVIRATAVTTVVLEASRFD